MDSLLARESVPDRAKLFFAGRLVQQTRNAEGLEAIVQDFFGDSHSAANLRGSLAESARGLLLPAGRFSGKRQLGCDGHRRLSVLDLPAALPAAHGADEARRF